MRSRFAVLLMVCCMAALAAAGDISVLDYGVRPDSGQDAAPGVAQALEACRGVAEPVLVFPPGRYDFFPEHAARCDYFMSNTLPVNPKMIGLHLTGMKGLTIRANQALFTFHDRMSPIIIDNCENVTLEGLAIDWDIPVIAQGKIVRISGNDIELEIDAKQFPYEVRRGRIKFKGEGWEGTVFGHILFDGATGDVRYGTQENPFGDAAFIRTVQEIGPGRISIRSSNAGVAREGDLLAIRHTHRRDTTGIFIYRSRNTTLRDVRVHHAVGTGILGQRSENITLDQVFVQPNAARNRIVSTWADATHFSGCRGVIRMEHCDFTGQMDDWTNVHGTTVPIGEIIAPDTVIGRFEHKESRGLLLYEPGDEAVFIDQATMQRGERRVVKSCEALSMDEFKLVFTEPLPQQLRAGDVLENMTWTPELEVRNCVIQRRHRARGMLITTPRRVVIESNEFHTAGAAILIEGDAQYWFESGAVTDVLIRGNVFRDCYSSGAWGEAPITITPSFRPQDETAEPYHRNIRIVDNTFHVFDYRILYARSVRDLVFSGNTIIRSQTFAPFEPRKSFIFDGCRGVVVKDNRVEGEVLGLDVQTEHMTPEDLDIAPGQGITR